MYTIGIWAMGLMGQVGGTIYFTRRYHFGTSFGLKKLGKASCICQVLAIARMTGGN
jgi:hypothetical protein